MKIDENGNYHDDDVQPVTINILGNKNTVKSVVLLLAFIRNILRNKTSGTIVLNVGGKVEPDFFNFDVNGLEIRDYKAADRLDID